MQAVGQTVLRVRIRSGFGQVSPSEKEEEMKQTLVETVAAMVLKMLQYDDTRCLCASMSCLSVWLGIRYK